MKLINLMAIATTFLNFNIWASDLIIPEGEFSCAVQFEENIDIEMVDGEDFPRFLGHLEEARVRKESLNLLFSNDGGELGIELLNPESLPNWLLVNESQYTNQEGYAYIDEDNREIFYQVSWSHTWYFGSGIDVITKDFDGKTLKIDLRFNDNDSVGELHKWVKCLKK